MNKKTPEYQIEMQNRRGRRLAPVPYIPLCDNLPEPKLIGWYNLATGLILTANFNPSLGGSSTKPNLAHNRRVRALDDRVKLAVKEVAASAEAEAPAES
jgi:hypothetical protein